MKHLLFECDKYKRFRRQWSGIEIILVGKENLEKSKGTKIGNKRSRLYSFFLYISI